MPRRVKSFPKHHGRPSIEKRGAHRDDRNGSPYIIYHLLHIFLRLHEQFAGIKLRHLRHHLLLHAVHRFTAKIMGGTFKIYIAANACPIQEASTTTAPAASVAAAGTLFLQQIPSTTPSTPKMAQRKAAEMNPKRQNPKS